MGQYAKKFFFLSVNDVLVVDVEEVQVMHRQNARVRVICGFGRIQLMKRMPYVEVSDTGIPDAMQAGTMAVLDLIAEDAMKMPSHVKVELNLMRLSKLLRPHR
jgi:hypothetical protein